MWAVRPPRGRRAHRAAGPPSYPAWLAVPLVIVSVLLAPRPTL